MVGIQVVHLASRLVFFFRTMALAAGGRDIVLVIRYGSGEIEGCDEEESYFAWSGAVESLVYQKVDIVVLAASRIFRYEQGLNLSSRFALWELRRIVSKVEQQVEGIQAIAAGWGALSGLEAEYLTPAEAAFGHAGRLRISDVDYLRRKKTRDEDFARLQRSGGVRAIELGLVGDRIAQLCKIHEHCRGQRLQIRRQQGREAVINQHVRYRAFSQRVSREVHQLLL